MRLPCRADFPPPPPANDRTGLIHWPADALRPAARVASPRRPRRLLAVLEPLLPLGLMVLVLWAAGFRF
jgi:hypothetical protein